MAKLKKMNKANLKTVARKASKDENMSTLGGRTKSNSVPQDVKEGHFAVVAVAAEGDETEQEVHSSIGFVWTHPSFQRLLEQAAEEYGFDHNGALTVPCRPSELEGIWAEQWHQTDEGMSSSSSVSSSSSTTSSNNNNNNNQNGRRVAISYSSVYLLSDDLEDMFFLPMAFYMHFSLYL
ncbi:hypothetical protein F8388_000119 [Cannabis sativa]|uniref:Uncharacterized protein n=1 Tax=Cannabis sativa TaxID=3483 RepID=A0A7J6FML9_CANSA|nr:hypothetical protein F8388_000119 [Cannabis sativa]